MLWPADVPLLSTQMSQKSFLFYKNHHASTAWDKKSQGSRLEIVQKPSPTWSTGAQICQLLLQTFCYKNKRASSYFKYFIWKAEAHINTALRVVWCVQIASTLQQSLPSWNDFSSTGGVYSESIWKTHFGCFIMQVQTNIVEIYSVK